MTDHREHTRRIAINTLMLYVRMLVMMFLGLFTSRIVLEALGENDFGVYNVIGGVVGMFTVISGSLTGAVSRFITFEIGKGDSGNLNKVYSTAVNIQFAISLIVILLAEPIGLWFIDNEMTIDPSRIPAARYVLHFSLLAFIFNLLSVPQMAMITAHEKMTAYAYIGILDGVLRFSVALLICSTSSDRLVLYSALMALSVLVVRFAYGWYSRSRFKDCRYRLVYDRGLLKEMFSFAGWDFIGVSSGVLRDQGGNVLINIFFGTAVNAARGVAVQLSGAVQGFVTNFMTAVSPQITKSYASGDHDYMFSLIRKSARMSYYLLFVLTLPVFFTTDFLMNLWLKDVPEYSVLFVQLFLVFSLGESLSRPLITALLATGRIRNYQLAVGGLQLMNLPVSYVLLKNGMGPEVTIIVSIVISHVCLFVRLFLFNSLTGFSVSSFTRRVYLNVAAMTAAALVLPLLLMSIAPDGVAGFMIKACVAFLSAVMAVLFVGCSRVERCELWTMFVNRFSRE